MPWMVVPNEIEDQIHVVPICHGGHIIPPHTLNYDCSCKPEMEEAPDTLLVYHNDMIGNADARDFH